MNVIQLYEDLKKHLNNPAQFDDNFYDAPEGEIQIVIVEEILDIIKEEIAH